MYKLTGFLLGIFVFACSHAAGAETRISGFASFAGGVLVKGDQFLADYPHTGVYDSDFSFSPDTTFGVQFKKPVDENLEFVAQVVGRSAHEFQSDIDWAYLNYSLTPEWSVQVGRKRLPLYFYSDFFDLGFAYHWIRPPADNYTWQLSSYNGASLLYEPSTDNWDIAVNLYTGREDDKDNALLSFLANNNRVDESWRNILGLVAEISNETYEFRFTVMGSQLYRDVNNAPISSGVAQLFYGLSVNARFSPLELFSEFNHYEREADEIFVNTYMLSAVWRSGEYAYHITHSELKQDINTSGADEHHTTSSIGLRKELSDSTALKVQYDSTRDLATKTTVVGDGELLSVAIDIVF